MALPYFIAGRLRAEKRLISFRDFNDVEKLRSSYIVTYCAATFIKLYQFPIYYFIRHSLYNHPYCGERDLRVDRPSIDCFFAPPRRKRFIFLPPSEEMKTARAHPFHSILPFKRRFAPPNAARTILPPIVRRTRARTRTETPTIGRATDTDTGGNNSGSRHIRRMDGRTDGRTDLTHSVSHGADIVEVGRAREIRKFSQDNSTDK